jgi:hypothetical protein
MIDLRERVNQDNGKRNSNTSEDDDDEKSPSSGRVLAPPEP